MVLYKFCMEYILETLQEETRSGLGTVSSYFT